jgi:hypothetical protein
MRRFRFLSAALEARMSCQGITLTKLAAFLGIFFVASAAGTQQFEYQFQDRPYEEANVVVVSHSIKQGSGSDSYLVGRVFNRGIKTARNVRIVYSVRNQYGASLPTNPYSLNPSDIPPTSFADFELRILYFVDPRDNFVTVRAEWDK